jgi:hypothetical protein
VWRRIAIAAILLTAGACFGFCFLLIFASLFFKCWPVAVVLTLAFLQVVVYLWRSRR